MNNATISRLELVSAGINPPHEYLVPALSVDSSISTLEHAKLMARKINIIVPKELQDVLKEVEERVGSKELATANLAALAVAKQWRKSLAKVLREVYTIFKGGETLAYLRMKHLVSTPRRIITLFIVFLIGIIVGSIIGWTFGSTWAVSPQPPASMPYQPYNVSIVTPPTSPALPPPPPVTSLPSGIQPAQPPTPLATG